MSRLDSSDVVLDGTLFGLELAVYTLMLAYLLCLSAKSGPMQQSRIDNGTVHLGHKVKPCGTARPRWDVPKPFNLRLENPTQLSIKCFAALEVCKVPDPQLGYMELGLHRCHRRPPPRYHQCLYTNKAEGCHTNQWQSELLNSTLLV